MTSWIEKKIGWHNSFYVIWKTNILTTISFSAIKQSMALLDVMWCIPYRFDGEDMCLPHCAGISNVQCECVVYLNCNKTCTIPHSSYFWFSLARAMFNRRPIEKKRKNLSPNTKKFFFNWLNIKHRQACAMNAHRWNSHWIASYCLLYATTKIWAFFLQYRTNKSPKL